MTCSRFAGRRGPIWSTCGPSPRPAQNCRKKSRRRSKPSRPPNARASRGTPAARPDRRGLTGIRRPGGPSSTTPRRGSSVPDGRPVLAASHFGPRSHESSARLVSDAPGSGGTPHRGGSPRRGSPRPRRPAGRRGREPSVIAFAAVAHGLRNDPAQIQGGHVLLRELERLLVRHPALLQGRIEVRDRLPEFRGCVFPVDRIRQAVQEGGHLLLKDGEDLLYVLRLHLVSLFPVPEQAGPCIWGNRALVTTSRQ